MNGILVVDDEVNNRRAMRRIFGNADYSVELAESGEAAMGMIAASAPDLVILDIMMPGMDGYEVCGRLKSNPETSDIMVLLLSAKGSLEDRLKGYDVKADDYIIKPYDIDELKAKVRILIRLKNARDELKRINHDLEKVVQERTRELVKKERQAVVGQMVQGIVHNIRGPLMAASCGLEMGLDLSKTFLENTSDDRNEAEKWVQKITHQLHSATEAVKKADRLIQNLLVKGRQDAVENRQKLDLNDLIRKEVEFLDADMEVKHGIKKVLNLAPSIPTLSGVYSDFSQVIYDMVTNASDAMRHSEKKELTITTRAENNHIRVEFRDTGSGITQENLDKIFDPFFTTKPKNGDEKEGEPTGTGLGLYTCTQLLKPYAAEISVESREGEGTCFTISLPTNGC